jgi:phosphatidylglycerophosphate synthase
VQTPEPFPPAEQEPFFEPEEDAFVRPAATGFWALGGRLAWIAGLVLTISAFTDWYDGRARQARVRDRAGPDRARPRA